MAMLNVDNINVYYGAIHAVKDVSLHVNEGEIVTLIGANGAGKTTTLQTISGLLHARSGSITFQDQSIGGIPAHKLVSLGMAQVPEGRRVFLQMSVKENLEMGAYTRPNSEVDASIAEVYERFPRLKERMNQVAGTLSGGEQQMLAMGRALMSKPKLLLLDEPAAGMNPSETAELMDTIVRIRDEFQIAILLIEHDMSLVMGICEASAFWTSARSSPRAPPKKFRTTPRSSRPIWAAAERSDAPCPPC